MKEVKPILPVALSIDIGGSKFMTGYVDAKGKVLASTWNLWSDMTRESIMKDVINAVYDLKKAYPQYEASVIGVTIPGLADSCKGLWVESCFSEIKNLPVRDILYREFAMPVYIDNDTRACAVAEHRWGACQGVDDFIWITVSNGIGGAVYTNGCLYSGKFNNAGEVGHIVIEEGIGARKCRCGNSGCAEAYASGRGLRKNYLSMGGQIIIDGEPANAKKIDLLARQGDKVALEAYRMEGIYLGRVVSVCASLLNPSKIILGGGVAMGFDLFKTSLFETVDTHVYKSANPELLVEKTALGYNAALLGAAALAFIGSEKGSQ